MSLQLRRGAGAPSTTLAAGEPYFDTTNNIMWLGDGSINHAYPGYREPDIKITQVTIPAITADTREVVEVILGALDNPKVAYIGAYLDAVPDIAITGQLASVSMENAGQGTSTRVMANDMPYPMYPNTINTVLRVTEDYTVARRFNSGNSNEKYGDGAGTNLPFYYNYTDINVGVFVGWYSVPNKGIWGIDKRVECESMWLTTVAGVTTLSIALYNRDASANSTLDLKIATFE